MENQAQNTTSVQNTIEFFEGSSMLTSGQRKDIEKHVANMKRSYENKMFDGHLYDALQVAFSDKPEVLQAMADSIQDAHCTKSFYDVPTTIKQFDGFTEPEKPSQLWNINVRVACAVVSEIVGKPKLKPIELRNQEDLWSIFSNPKASAGLIAIGKSKKEAIDVCFNDAMQIKRSIVNHVPFDKIRIPAQMFHTARIGGFIVDGKYSASTLKHKDRLIYGLDGATVSVEGQYAKPFIQYVAKDWFGYAGGKSPEILRDNISYARRCSAQWMSIDYTHFDQTVPSWLISWCFTLIKKCFDPKYHDELNWIEHNFINTAIAIPGKGICCKHKGIPSGSNFTQVIGSMVNAVMMLTYIASTVPGSNFRAKLANLKTIIEGPDHRDVFMFVMGDDNLVFTTKGLDLDDMSKYVNVVFGVKINPEKCDLGSYVSDPTFLKREWRTRGEYQDPCYLAVNVIHSESKRLYKGYSPWHIIYGLYLTYSESFDALTERQIVERMEHEGGIDALERIPKSDLPGVFRSFGDDAIKSMVLRAERLVARAQVS